MAKLMNIHIAGSDLLTGLPEYRNGGLLIDMGLLALKDADLQRGIAAYKQNAQIKGQPNVEVVPLFSADDDVVVEWRAVTVGFLDDLLMEVNNQLGLRGEEQLTLAQMLEAGSWKVGCLECAVSQLAVGFLTYPVQGGREIAEVSRPNTKEPPIMILSDGTVF
jgi:hypothetical protein